MKNKRLKVYRILAERSQNALAKESGLSQSKLSKIESGQLYPPSDADKQAISNALAKALSKKLEKIIF